MTYQEIYNMLAETDVPVAYYQFQEGTGQAPPFICFYYPGINDAYADGRNYQRITDLTIELYTDEKNFELEAALEAVLDENGFAYAKEETYIDTEKMYEVIYSTEVVITATEE